MSVQRIRNLMEQLRTEGDTDSASVLEHLAEAMDSGRTAAMALTVAQEQPTYEEEAFACMLDYICEHGKEQTHDADGDEIMSLDVFFALHDGPYHLHARLSDEGYHIHIRCQLGAFLLFSATHRMGRQLEWGSGGLADLERTLKDLRRRAVSSAA